MLARRRGDFGAAVAEARPVLVAEASTAGLGDAVRAVALTNLGIVELWSARLEEAQRHFAHALDLARLGGWPWIEVQCLPHLAVTAALRWQPEARERVLEAIAICEAHGWAADRVVGAALVALAALDVLQGRFEEAEQWLNRAEQAVRPDIEPATGLLLHLTRGMLQAACGRHEGAVVAFRAAAELEAHLAGPHLLSVPAHCLLAEMQVRLGDTAAARATLAGLPDDQRTSSPARAALAFTQLAEGDVPAAVDVLAPVLDGLVPSLPLEIIEALLLDARARDLLGEMPAAESDVERALELAEPDGFVWPFVVTPVRELLEGHPRHRTAHGALLRDVLDVFAGKQAPTRTGELPAVCEELTESELRVLRYLPSNLSAREIGRELYLSVHTVKTHMWRIYTKLGAHRRTEAVERARELRLLAPSLRFR